MSNRKWTVYGRAGHFRAWGRYFHGNFWENYWLFSVYPQENERLFLVWPTIAQHIKLRNFCDRIGENSGCVLRALLKLFLNHGFSWFWLRIRVQLFKIRCPEAHSIKITFGSLFFQHSGIFRLPKMRCFQNTCMGRVRSCIVRTHLCEWFHSFGFAPNVARDRRRRWPVYDDRR